MTQQRTEEVKCDVCDGDGTYPVIDSKGSHRYSIRCPECFGSGKYYVEAIEEPIEWPPPSTAASIHTTEQLREAVKDWNEGRGK